MLSRRRKRKSRTRTLRQIILRSCLFLFILPLCVLWPVLLYSSHSAVMKNTARDQTSIVGMVSQMYEKEFARMRQEMKQIGLESNVQKILRERYLSTYTYNAYRDMDQYIRYLNNSENGIANVILVDNEGGVYCNTLVPSDVKQNIAEEAWYQRAMDASGGCALVGASVNYDNVPVFIVSQRIVNTGKREFIGVICIMYKLDVVFEPIYSQLSDTANLSIFDQSGRELFAWVNDPQQRKLAEVAEEVAIGTAGGYHEVCGQQIVVAAPLNAEKTQVAISTSVSGVMTTLTQQQMVIFLGFLGCLVLFLIVMAFIYRRISQPINNIVRMIKESPKESAVPCTCYEMKQINDGIISLVKKNQEGDERIIQLVDRCETMTLDKLQAQINPHFLYNTLTSIKYTAIQCGQPQIGQMITALVKLLRSAINRDGAIIPIRQEIDTLRQYIFIENAIYNGNIQFILEVQDAILDGRVPNFILQPLVENCIFHGIDSSRPGGVIQVRGFLQESAVLFEVQDNGVGFDPNQMLKILMSEQEKSKQGLTNMGIRSVQTKIHMLCGHEYGITIFSDQGKGALFRIRLPFPGPELKERET